MGNSGIIKICGELTGDIAPCYCNHYTYCEGKCAYCWAGHCNRGTPSNTNWIKFNIVDDLKKELKKGLWKGKNVWVCNYADAYQPIEKSTELTRSVIKTLHDHGVEVTILTKYSLAIRDLDLEPDYVGISLISLNDDWRRRYEPYTDNAEERINVIENAHEIGLSTLINIEPLLRLEDFEPIYYRVVDFADKILLGKLNPRQKRKIDFEYPDYEEMMLWILKNYNGEVQFKSNWTLRRRDEHEHL